MTKQPKSDKSSRAEVAPSGLFADMPRWEREMKRRFGDLCSGEEQSTPKSKIEPRKSGANLSKELAQSKDKI